MNEYSDPYLKTTRSFWDHSYWPVIRQNFRVQGTVLDVGCGNGINTFNVLGDIDSTVSLIGVDTNQENLKKISDPRLKPKLGDCLALPFPENTFDLTFCDTLLCTINSRESEPEKAVSEMVRVTKIGGDVVCIEPAQGFSCGVRLMEFRPSDGTDLEHDEFWSNVRYAYLRGFRSKTGEDLHIGVRCISFLESNGLGNIWTKSFYHIIRGIDYSDSIDILDDLLGTIRKSWHTESLQEILKIGGLSSDIIKQADKTNKYNWNLLEKAIANLKKGKGEKQDLDSLRRMVIMVPMIVAGGTKM